MRRKIVVIGALTTMCLLSGCVKVKVDSGNVVVESLSEEETSAVNTMNTIIRDSESTIEKPTESNATKATEITDTEVEASTELESSPTETISSEQLPENIDYFEDVFLFDVPNGYAVLDDDTKTETSRMYVHSERGKVVGSVFLNYPDTSEYNENEITAAYEKTIEKKYKVITTGYLDTGDFKWDFYYGKLKDSKDDAKYGSVFVSVKDNTAVYLEFMHAEDYDDSAAIAKILNSFHYLVGEEEESSEK